MNDIINADMIKSLLNQLTFTGGENPKQTAKEIFRLFSIMYLYFHHIFRFWCRHSNLVTDFGKNLWILLFQEAHRIINRSANCLLYSSIFIKLTPLDDLYLAQLIKAVREQNTWLICYRCLNENMIIQKYECFKKILKLNW